jgi:3-hydroxyacyl-CoA dehydrogenase
MPATSIAVAGAGTMGSGIAQLAARSGCPVALIDTDPMIVQPEPL